ncbi:hypothetical protein ABT369_38990 [Dactylosporangium sp. NPDC000244]|uniref:hypothetical protein n=1 Tax=Dactylosporangium sp. NPDC000244 TaxID=3154365 RepID=UPI00332C705C
MTTVGVNFNPPGHDGVSCACLTRDEFTVAVYDQWGQRIAAVNAKTCGDDDSVTNPQLVAEAQQHLWPGKTVCVWRGVQPAPDRLADASPDAVVGGAL